MTSPLKRSSALSGRPDRSAASAERVGPAYAAGSLGVRETRMLPTTTAPPSSAARNEKRTRRRPVRVLMGLPSVASFCHDLGKARSVPQEHFAGVPALGQPDRRGFRPGVSGSLPL